jgi:hypothetical protein
MAKETCVVCQGNIKHKEVVVDTATRPPLETMRIGGKNPDLSGKASLKIASCEKCGLMYDPVFFGK